MVAVSSWGRLSREDHFTVDLYDRHQLNLARPRGLTGLPFGMGRSYGDVCLNPGQALWRTRGLDRFIEFDQSTGVLACEAGVQLADIERLMVPRGWSLPVQPGTLWLTVGGAIANDVHGKNHHLYGTFGDQLLGLTLLRTDGTLIECSALEHTDWFNATVGGMGLTGLIVQARMQLRPIASPWLETEAIPFESLARFFDLAKSSEPHWEHTVAWVDCLSGARGRGVFLRARPAREGQGPEAPQSYWPRSRELPLASPLSLVNAGTLRLLNSLYRLSKTSKKGIQFEHQRKFLQPLDVINNWNLIYGSKGFYQYQALLPLNHGEAALSAMLKDIECSGEGSFLATLKVFGPREPRGMMSFVRGGITLALDFPNRGATTSKLFDRLDGHVRNSGGRLYFAKDARMPRSLFEAGYPRLCEFLSYRDIGISSAMSRRLLGS